eukprot:CAMPEP_0179864924 /NCGR_PEP_ID=MMETSP0982-20121206/16489_1 /TAXON_ID=483367 /ORGANISM="non described non described, Strain CCMP 2436" /LENGTH=449 /DNA_ID=CAMNT_0021753435 /DNA_START=103 /DNA_END=1449 /DNA_ORIENTATION=+
MKPPMASRGPMPPPDDMPAVRESRQNADFIELLRSGKYADISLRSSGARGAKLGVHRAVLAARCGPTFVAYLEANLDSETGAFHVQGSAECARLLLQHVYADGADLPAEQPELLLELIALANSLQLAGEIGCLQRIKELAEQRIASDMSQAPAAELGPLLVQRAHEASEHGAKQLLRYCLRAIDANFEQLHAEQVQHALRTELAVELFKGRSPAPLQDALLHGRTDVAAALLRDAEPNEVRAALRARDALDRSPLEVAMLDLRARNAVELLLGHGHPLHEHVSRARRGAEPGDTLLHVAVRIAGKLAIQLARLGSENGLPPDADPGTEALCATFVDVLVSHGVPFLHNRAGLAAVDVALLEGNEACAKLLLDSGAKPLPTLLHRALQGGANASRGASGKFSEVHEEELWHESTLYNVSPRIRRESVDPGRPVSLSKRESAERVRPLSPN